MLEFCLLALLLTAGGGVLVLPLAAFHLCWRWSVSLASLVCQFGSHLRLLGHGLDPLAVLVPFLVFAIRVSHGVQQINFIVRESPSARAPKRRSASPGCWFPGTLA